MAVYRFKVTLEEYDDVTREIDIKAAQSFRDLHKAILSSIGFDDKHAASFFISDDQWRWGTELVLNEESRNGGLEGKKRSAPLSLMEKNKLVNSIEDPHQKFIYVYDYTVQWIMHVELVRILTPDPAKSYPFCSRSMGTAPKQYKVVLPPPEEENDDLAALLGKVKKNDDEAGEDSAGKEIITEHAEGLDEEDMIHAGELEEEDTGEPGADEEEAEPEDSFEDSEEK